MKQTFAFATLLLLTLSLAVPKAFGKIISAPFEFQFEQKTLRGLIEKSDQQKSQAIVILIPGYGRTNFVKGNWYATLRQKLVATGYS